MEFRPIETAPKDGTHFDAWNLEGVRYAKCKYGNFRGELDLCWWRDVLGEPQGIWTRLNASMFAHWTPIPDGPNAELRPTGAGLSRQVAP